MATDQFFTTTPKTPTPLTLCAPTGGTTLANCYGYGRDEDLGGLVVMADVNAARVFDQNFNLVTGPAGVNRIRNMAGFMSTVTRELVDRHGRSHVVGHMGIERGMLEPLVVFDTRITNPSSPYFGRGFLRRIESGPIEAFDWTVPPTSDYTKEEYDQLLATLDDVSTVTVRAVLVEGDAPLFIDDMDDNGKYDSRDLKMMGYTLLSNQAKKTITIVQQDKYEDFGGEQECPATSVIFGQDMDGDQVGYFCFDGDGNSRSFKRVPQ